MKAHRPCVTSHTSALFTVLLYVALTGCCPHGGEVAPLAGITGLNAAISDGTATLSWIDPEFDFDHIAINWTPDGPDAEIVAKGTQSCAITGLSNGTAYTFTVRSINSSGAVTSEATVDAKPGIPVYDADDLNKVRGKLDGYYILMGDISLSAYSEGEGWTPIGTTDPDEAFTGTFDGNGHSIIGLRIARTADNQGLFGVIGAGGLVKDLLLSDCGVSGTDNVGALAGKNHGGTVSDCRTEGSVNGDSYVGGLIGQDLGIVYGNNAIIEYSHSACNVTGYNEVGGLVGTGSRDTIRFCGAAGNIAGIVSVGGCVGSQYVGETVDSYAVGYVSGTSRVGGFAGFVMDASISDCYARGNASAHEFVGGFLGDIYQLASGTMFVYDCYSTGAVSGDRETGGFTGHKHDESSLERCYYDSQTSSQSDTARGEPRSTAQMKLQSTYDDGPGDGTDDDWDFTSAWAIDTDGGDGYANDGYPYLRSNAATN